MGRGEGEESGDCGGKKIGGGDGRFGQGRRVVAEIKHLGDSGGARKGGC